jgi:hypothetical protein
MSASVTNQFNVHAEPGELSREEFEYMIMPRIISSSSNSLLINFEPKNNNWVRLVIGMIIEFTHQPVQSGTWTSFFFEKLKNPLMKLSKSKCVARS